MLESEFSYAAPEDGFVRRRAIQLIEILTGRQHLEKLYQGYRALPEPRPPFFSSSVQSLDLKLNFSTDRLAAIPKSGPLVVVANHPYGVLDGIILCDLISRVRPDFRILANAVLWRAEELREHVLPIDFAETRDALKTTLTSRQQARSHLANGGVLLVFPAGMVATSKNLMGNHLNASDRRWGSFTAQLITRTKSQVLPVYFDGQNSVLFQVASHIHEALRLSLLFREVRRRMGQQINIAIGAVLPFTQLDHFDNGQALADHLQETTFALRNEISHPTSPNTRRFVEELATA
jgi:putative hemolysin